MAKQSYYKKLIKKLEKIIYEEEGFSENFEDVLSGALFELQRRKYYLPVIPGEEFWYVTESLFDNPPIIKKVKCKNIGWNKKHKQVTIILEDGSEVYDVEFEKNAFLYEGSAQRYYSKLIRGFKNKQGV